MHRVIAAVLAVTACASTAQAQTSDGPPDGPILTLAQAIERARASAPSLDAAHAGIRAADAGRRVAGLRPNPTASADIENVGGSRAYHGIEAPKQTVAIGLPLELGGKRPARIAVAESQRGRAGLDQALAEAELRESVTDAYVETIAAERRLGASREQARIAGETVHGAQARVEAGKASPLERQRADVLHIAADADVQKSARLATLARANLERRLGQPIAGRLDQAWFERIEAYGPVRLPDGMASLPVAAATADRRTAEALLRLARAQRIPDVTVSTGVRRLPATNSVAAIFGVSVPLPLFNSGSAAIEQATAERDKADAQRRSAMLDTERQIAQAQAELANAQAAATTAVGPALAAALEAARIARIGYREGKFAQLDLLDAERSLSETRTTAIDALAAYHRAQARLERLAATLPSSREDDR
ncbi:TolC family protein [Sphingomonas abietis]|uniref:TolC family protein n=1 Tax=Sphingomonas abietis TaxID=3012344 RepID=A0ABY7NKN4_9SPHN|nr:TolC family protein [Sphingomonas abietis]WBO21530.1 TolC family protein [Sphingomonas abietis]